MQARGERNMGTTVGRRARGTFALVTALLVTGCATTGVTGEQQRMLAVSCSQTVQPEHQVQLDLVDSLTAREQPYAALAKLESEGLETEQHWLRRGQLLATTQQLAGAEEVFQALVEECHSARAHHGLGLVYLKQHRLDQGLAQLATARKKAPSSADVRNDYGYALLLSGHQEDAVFELRTAFELADGQGAVRQNLAAAYVINGDRTGLAMLRNKYDFGVEEYAHAEKLADDIRRQL